MSFHLLQPTNFLEKLVRSTAFTFIFTITSIMVPWKGRIILRGERYGTSLVLGVDIWSLLYHAGATIEALSKSPSPRFL